MSEICQKLETIYQSKVPTRRRSCIKSANVLKNEQRGRRETFFEVIEAATAGHRGKRRPINRRNAAVLRFENIRCEFCHGSFRTHRTVPKIETLHVKIVEEADTRVEITRNNSQLVETLHVPDLRMNLLSIGK